MFSSVQMSGAVFFDGVLILKECPVSSNLHKTFLYLSESLPQQKILIFTQVCHVAGSQILTRSDWIIHVSTHMHHVNIVKKYFANGMKPVTV